MGDDKKMNMHNDSDMDYDEPDIDENVFSESDLSEEEFEEEKKIEEDEPIKNKIVEYKEQKNQEQNEKINQTVFKGVNVLTCSDDEIRRVFHLLKDKWMIDDYESIQMSDLMKMWEKTYKIHNTIDMDELKSNYSLLYMECMSMVNVFQKRNLFEQDKELDPYYINLKKIMFLINYSYRILGGTINSKRLMDPTFDTLSNLDETYFRCSTIDTSKVDDSQQLKLFLLGQLSFIECRRYNNYVCQQKYINGRATHYWEKRWTIEEFIEEYTDIHKHFKMWQIREKSNNHSEVIKYLKEKNCRPYFPDVVRTSCCYAFKNGLYYGRHRQEDGKLGWKFYEYDGDEVIPNDLVACKYFDIDFTAHQYTKSGTTDGWRDIPSEYYDKITKFQFQLFKNDSEDIYDFLLILLGRLLAPLGQYDKWEVFPFLIGTAGCGKSMIVNMVEYLFENVDIGHVQDTNEGKFAYGPFFHKKILTSTEIKKSFNTPATLFQQFISAEHVTLPIKGKDPVEGQWIVPILFAGNELFGLADKGGSIGRRTIRFSFLRTVREENRIMDMMDRLQANIGNLLHKMTCAYVEKLNQLGIDSIWKDIPEYFKKQREDVTRESNNLYAFLNDKTLIEYDEKYECSINDLKNAYNLYCKANHYPHEQFRPDLYLAPFSDMSFKLGYNIEVEKDAVRETTDEDGEVTKEKPQDYVIGLRLID